MNIQQEFIKVFNLIRCDYILKKKDKTVWAHSKEECIKFVKSGWKVIKANRLPDYIITPEIVLKLLELVLMRDKYAFYFNRSSGNFVVCGFIYQSQMAVQGVY